MKRKSSIKPKSKKTSRPLLIGITSAALALLATVAGFLKGTKCK